MRPTRLLLPLLAAALLAACQAAPAPQAPAPFPGQIQGRGMIAVAPTVTRGAARQLLAVVTPWVETDIDHMVVKLFHPSDPLNPRQTVSVDADALYNAITFSNLEHNKTYRVTADAYKAPGEAPADLISNAATSYVDIVVTTDDRPAMGNLVVDLADVAFAGEATTPGLTITPGGFETTNATTMVQADPLTLEVAETRMSTGPDAIAGVVQASNGEMFFANTTRNVIYRIPVGGPPEMFAGIDGSADESIDGSGTFSSTGPWAHFNEPHGLAIDEDDQLYVADKFAVRKISNPGAVVTTIAGHATTGGDVPLFNTGPEGDGTAVRFNRLRDLAVDPAGHLIVADENNDRLRKVELNGRTSNYSAGIVPDATGVARGRDGSYYVSSPTDAQVYRVPSDGASPLPFAGRNKTGGSVDGPYGTGTLANPRGLAFDAAGHLYIATIRQVRKADPGRRLTTIAGHPSQTGTAQGSLFQGAGDFGDARFTNNAGLLRHGTSLFVTDAGTSRLVELKPNP